MTTEPNPAPVSQMAREYAWDARPTAFRQHDEVAYTRENWMAGRYDWLHTIQAFARFEQAIRSTQVGEDRNG